MKTDTSPSTETTPGESAAADCWASFIGEYPLRGKRFGCRCVARSLAEAQAIMKGWGIGAILLGKSDRTDVAIPVPGENDFEHWLVYFAWLAIASGEASALSLLADDGLVHELMHLHEGVVLVGDDDPMIGYRRLAQKLGLLPVPIELRAEFLIERTNHVRERALRRRIEEALEDSLFGTDG